jgi:hypothetical protein
MEERDQATLRTEKKLFGFGRNASYNGYS